MSKYPDISPSVFEACFQKAPWPQFVLDNSRKIVIQQNDMAVGTFGSVQRFSELLGGADNAIAARLLDRSDEELDGSSIVLDLPAGSHRATLQRVSQALDSYWLVSLEQVVVPRAGSRENPRDVVEQDTIDVTSRLAGEVARSFRNVLQAISLINDGPRLAEVRPSKAEPSEPILDAAIAEALAVGGDLLGMWSALAQPPSERRKRRIDIVMTAQRCVKLVRLMSASVDDLRVELPSEPIELDGDEGQLSQLILGLSLRARDAITRGFGSSLKIQLERVDDRVVLRVIDDGERCELSSQRGGPEGVEASPDALFGAGELAANLGGSLTFRSPVTGVRGTEVTVVFPCAVDPYPRRYSVQQTSKTVASRRDSVWTHVHEPS